MNKIMPNYLDKLCYLAEIYRPSNNCSRLIQISLRILNKLHLSSVIKEIMDIVY